MTLPTPSGPTSTTPAAVCPEFVMVILSYLSSGLGFHNYEGTYGPKSSPPSSMMDPEARDPNAMV